jgi:hypothetical protein
VLEVAPHLGQRDTHRARHFVQMNGVPAALLAEGQRRVEDGLADAVGGTVAPRAVDGDRCGADQSHRNSR